MHNLRDLHDGMHYEIVDCAVTLADVGQYQVNAIS